MKHDYAIYPTLLDSFYWAKRLGKWQELIDKINRVKPAEYPISVTKGMRFEDVVNDRLNKTIPELVGTYSREQFTFKADLVNKIVKKLSNNLGQQKYIESVVATGLGNVKLYGFVDYVYSDKFIDLKTTEKYKAGKYLINSQHKCYPLIGNKKEFIYLITDFSDIFIEPYTFTAELRDSFIYELQEFIEWLETNRVKITDKKIFNQ